MIEHLRRVTLFEGLGADAIQRLANVGRARVLRAGEYLFLLGDSANYICVVMKGQIDLCCPISAGGAVRDIAIETVGPGGTVGWSALVKPYRFTLSARAAEATELMAFSRHDLNEIFEADPDVRRVVLTGITQLVANRLSTFQALWARELQRQIEAGRQGAIK